jgi:hypothetical protein
VTTEIAATLSLAAAVEYASTKAAIELVVQDLVATISGTVSTSVAAVAEASANATLDAMAEIAATAHVDAFVATGLTAERAQAILEVTGLIALGASSQE